MTYDPLGRLYQTTSGSTTTRFIYDGDRIAGEYDGSGNLLRRYAYGPAGDNPLVWYEGSTVGQPNRRYLHPDHQGSIIVITDGSGTTLAVNQYDPYGIRGSQNQGRFQYTGQAFIPELGLHYYKARMYNAAVGRFMQTDPIGYKDDLNLYAYVYSDPINNEDPSGDACVSGLNSGSDFCGRAKTYAQYDGVVGSKSRFFAAASATVTMLASMDIPVAGTFGTSASTRSFLATLSGNLEKTNARLEASILKGDSPPGSGSLDQKMVHTEQSEVQNALDGFSRSSPGGYKDLISEVNKMLNPSGMMQSAGTFFATDKAYGRVLDSVRQALGRDIDFSKQGDREAIGNAVIDEVRRNGGCLLIGIPLACKRD